MSFEQASAMSPGNEYLLTPNRAGTVPSLRLRLRTFRMPPIGDGAVIGRQAPVGQSQMKKTLRLISHESFVGIDVRDSVVGAILVRESILRKIGWAKVREIVMRCIKPVMVKTEILALNLEVEVAIGESL
jgi:hypothetical protein